MAKIASFKVSMLPRAAKNKPLSSGGAVVSPSYAHEQKIADRAIQKALRVRAGVK